jgi:hypothetical protein
MRMAQEKPDTLNATAIASMPGNEIPARFSNLFHILVAGDITRLVFSEGLGGQRINSHTAIVMPTTDAAELARILTDTIATNRVLAAAADQSLAPVAQSATGTVSSNG